MTPPGVEYYQNSSTFNRLCAYGCGASVKPGQWWREPACKARAYRAGQRVAREHTDKIESELWDAIDKVIELGNKLEALERAHNDLEEAYRLLWEEHQALAVEHRRLKVALAGWPGDDPYVVLGVRPEAPLVVIEAAWKALAWRYHPDRGGPTEAMQRINRAHDRIIASRDRE